MNAVKNYRNQKEKLRELARLERINGEPDKEKTDEEKKKEEEKKAKDASELERLERKQYIGKRNKTIEELAN